MNTNFNILFPIAGKGTRFISKGFSDPKPFIMVKHKHIIEYALSSLNIPGKYYIIVNQLEKKYKDILLEIIKKYNLDGEIIDIGHDTLGQADTCLLVSKTLDKQNPLIITNGDQYTPWNSSQFLKFISSEKYDGVVSTYNHEDVIVGMPSKYSHIKVDDNNLAIELREKIAISKLSLNGIFYWKHTFLFNDSASQLMSTVTKQEKFISLTYNYLIHNGYKITYYPMAPNDFVSLGSPEEIETNWNKL